MTITYYCKLCHHPFHIFEGHGYEIVEKQKIKYDLSLEKKEYICEDCEKMPGFFVETYECRRCSEKIKFIHKKMSEDEKKILAQFDYYCSRHVIEYAKDYGSRSHVLRLIGGGVLVGFLGDIKRRLPGIKPHKNE